MLSLNFFSFFLRDALNSASFLLQVAWARREKRQNKGLYRKLEEVYARLRNKRVERGQLDKGTLLMGGIMKFAEYEYCMKRKCKECKIYTECDLLIKQQWRLTYKPFENLKEIWERKLNGNKT